jgi:hypothetical protein
MKNRGPKEQVALRWLDDEQKSGQTEFAPNRQQKARSTLSLPPFGALYPAYPVGCQLRYWVSPLTTVEHLVSGC